MSKARILLVLGLVLLAAGYVALRPGSAGNLDAFARCLASKGLVMYGADWCAHCQNEKRAFGDSFRFVPYVECPDEPQRCLAAGVAGYPTWIFPDGRRLEGEQGLAGLAGASGCKLSQKD